MRPYLLKLFGVVLLQISHSKTMEGPLGVEGIKNAAQVSEDAKLGKVSQPKGVAENLDNSHDQNFHGKDFLKDPAKQGETGTKDLKADGTTSENIDWTEEDTKKPYVDRVPPPPDNRPLWRRMGGWVTSSIGKFFKWLFLSGPERKVKGAKLPNKELEEIFKGPWYRRAWLRYSPRPPTEKEDEKMTTMSELGRKLRKNRAEGEAQWKKRVAERGASNLRQHVLSTPLFFQLAEDYSRLVESAERRQKDIVKMGKELAGEWGGESKMKDLFVKIEEACKEEYNGLVASQLDTKYYQHQLSPLLLLTAEKTPRVDTVLAEAGIATKTKNGISRMDVLTQYATRYQKHVDHFKKTEEKEAAIKDYLQATERIQKHHQAFADDVLERFRNKHLEENGGDQWLLDYKKPSEEEQTAKDAREYVKEWLNKKKPSF